MKNKVLSLAAMAVLMGASTLKAQLNVGSNIAPDASAVLQASSTSKGFLPPVMTSTQRNGIANPAVGLIIYNSTTNQVEVNTGSTSTAIWTSGSAASFYTADGTLTGNRIVTMGTNALNFVGTGKINIDGNALTGTGASITGIGIGIRADGGLNLGQNTTPAFMMAVGYRAGNANTGIYNSFLGISSGLYNTSGANNSFTGYQSGLNNTTGSDNTFLGFRSGYANTTGSNNVAIGDYTGQYNVGASLVTLLGYNAGGGSSITNATAIGANATVSASNSLVLGGTGANAVSVGIGTATPAATLDVVGNMHLGTTVSGATTDSVLTINAATGIINRRSVASIASQTPSTNIYTADGTLSGNRTVAIGTNALNFTGTGILNTDGNALTGTGASITGIGIGVRADGGLNLGQNTTASNLVAVGYRSGFVNTGANNSFFGTFSGVSNTSGAYNTFLGGSAAQGNTTGANNTIIGYQSALFNTTGSDNVFLGFRSGYANGTGSNNVAIGDYTGQYNVGASLVTLLGYNAGGGSGITNATAIGANATVSASNSLVLGGTGTNAVSVGIGTATPAATLDVVGGINLSGALTGTGASITGIGIGVRADGGLNLGQNTTTRAATWPTKPFRQQQRAQLDQPEQRGQLDQLAQRGQLAHRVRSDQLDQLVR